MRQKLFNLFKDKGFIITLAFSLIVLCIFFGKPLFHANSVFFGVDGDGIQAYYTSLYHALYDSSFIHFNGMNYPYGENVFFTGCQPTVTGFCGLFGLSGFIIGITNLIMLLSVPLSAAFLYLIFKELNVQYLYAAVCAVAIAYLSPQLMRMHAHYTLTYQFAIPAFVYGLMKFHNAPSLKKSILIGIFSFFMASTHLYFFGFFAVLSGFYWLALFVLREPGFKNVLFCAKHFSIQLLIPFVILQLITVFTNTVHDRTAVPFGFMVYKSNWSGVFFPFDWPYEYIPRRWGIEPQLVNPEGLSYVGLIAVVMTIIFTLKLVRDVLNFEAKKFFMFSDNIVLNILIWSAITALLYSFAYPFVFGHEEWIKNLGFLKQMRAIGRFAWVFYYIINIAVVYVSYKFFIQIKYKFITTGILTCLALFLCFDAYQNIRGFNNSLNNRLPSLADKNNTLMENAWIKKMNSKDYQAIIPLPYFHVGSENFNIEPVGNIKKNTFIISLKTGLPITAVNLSRTSLSQSFKNIELMLEPSEPLKILEEMPNKKPFLVLVEKELLNKYESNLLDNCEYLYGSKEYSVYRLNYETLAGLWKKTRDKVVAEYNLTKTYKQGDYYSTDSIVRFLKADYDTAQSHYAFKGKGAVNVLANRYTDLYFGHVPNILPDTNYSVSFWMRNYVKDINLRTAFSIDCLDSTGKFYSGIYSTVKDYSKRIEENWILIEGIVKFRLKSDMLKVTVWSEHLNKTDSLEFDDLLARPFNVDVYKKENGKLYKNNRFYKLEN